MADSEQSKNVIFNYATMNTHNSVDPISYVDNWPQCERINIMTDLCENIDLMNFDKYYLAPYVVAGYYKWSSSITLDNEAFITVTFGGHEGEIGERNFELSTILAADEITCKNITNPEPCIAISIISDDYVADSVYPIVLARINNPIYFLDLREGQDLTLAAIANRTGGKYLKNTEESRLLLKALISEENKFPDTDGDGFYDFEEKLGLVVSSNGRLAQTSYTKSDTDDDGLYDNEEVDVELTKVEIPGKQGNPSTFKYYHHMWSDPTKADTDGDGLNDNEDKSPAEHFNKNFQVINDYNLDFTNIYPTTYNEKFDKVNSIYGQGNFKDKAEELKYQAIKSKIYLMCIGGYTNFSSLLNGFEWGSTPTAADLLFHYLSNSNNDDFYYIDNFPYAIALTKVQRISYYNLLNDYMGLVEDTAIKGETYVFSTTPDSQYTVSYYSGISSAIDADWYLSIGYAINGLISEVECYDKNGDTYYNAKIKFYLFDCYAWSDDSSERDLYNLHYYGLARSFRDYGCYETTITWKRGSRYPDNVSKDELPTTFFDGIVDSNLGTTYIEGYAFYNPTCVIM